MHSPHARNAVQLCLWRYARQRAVCFTRQPCWTTSFARIIANRELGSIFELRVLIPVLVNFERECDLQYRPVIISDVDADPALDAVVRPSGSYSLPSPQACGPLPLARFQECVIPHPLEGVRAERKRGARKKRLLRLGDAGRSACLPNGAGPD
jgi:hypothetical protein